MSQLSELEIDDDVINIVPKEIAQQHRCIPISHTGASLIVAMSDPSNTYAIDDLKFITGYDIEVVVASEAAVEEAFQRYYERPLHHKTAACIITCKHCGNKIPLPGPLRTVRCHACEGENHPEPSALAVLMIAADEPEPSTCSCGAPIDPAAIPLDLDGETSCPGCGAAIPVFPPPAWLQEELPALRQIINAEREGDASPPAKAGPVAVTCPSCDASLQLGGDTKRTTVCSYCGTTVALPDNIWRSLHPVPRARRFIIVWQGELERRYWIEERRRRIEERRRRIEVLAGETPETVRQEPAEVRVDARASDRAARLVCMSGNFAGQEWSLDRASMVIGRTEDNDVVIDHRSLNREHALVAEENGRYTITDLQSTNGVRVNGEECSKVELRGGDLIDLGLVRLRFVAPGEDFVFSRDGSGDTAKGGGHIDPADPPRKSGAAALVLIIVAIVAAAVLYFVLRHS